MTTLESLKPETRNRTIDVLAAAGLNISDWKGAGNRNQTSQWAFDDGTKILLSLWHEGMYVRPDGAIGYEFNATRILDQKGKIRSSAEFMSSCLAKAEIMGLAFQVAIVTHTERDNGVDKRELDTIHWHLESRQGNVFYLVRGARPIKPQYADQFSERQDETTGAAKEPKMGSQYVRSPEVRKHVLERATGVCECCGEEGFKTKAGSIYLETHHVTPLSEGGADTIDNVVGICPNCHKKAHYADNADEITIVLREVC